MHTLAKHIETLLVNHNCVVVPGLGGFVTQVQPAHYDEQDGCFVPPKRSVTFNSILSNNDGLLVERYQQYEHMSYYTATQRIAEQVAELKKRVHEDGQVELVGIGTLSANGDYGMKFAPKESGLMTPDLYALEPVFAEPANARKESIAPATHAAAAADEDSKKYYTLRLNRNVVNTLAAAVICVMFYFLVIPTGNITDAGPHMASMFPTQVAHRTTVKKQVLLRKREVGATPQSIAAASPDAGQETEAAAQAPAPQPEKTARKEYVIVMASAISTRYGNDYVSKLHKLGYESARILQTGSMKRVVMGHFSTSDEAFDFLRHLSDDEQYATCWVMDTPCE